MPFTLCTLNCNGIRAADKNGFSDWLAGARPDLLLMQELRARPEQVKPELRAHAGYSTRWACAEKKGYSGTAVYSRAPVDAYTVGTGLDWGDAEGRALRADLGDLSVISLYVPSGSSSEERQARKFAYLDHLCGWFDARLAEDRPMAICGDFNVAHEEADIWDPKGNAKNSGFLPEERAWFSALLEAGWVDVFRALHPDEDGLYSWWSNRGRARELDRGWRLDYVLCSPSLAARATEAWIERKAGLSDHAPVTVRFDWDPADGAPVGTGSLR